MTPSFAGTVAMDEVDERSPALLVESLTKSFSGQQALHEVDLDVRHGEIHALVGQNGSGKSTLIKVLAGYHEPDEGATILIDGHPLHVGSPGASHAAGMRFVHQDLGLVPALSVADNFRLGSADGRALARIDRAAERRRAKEGLQALGSSVDPGALVSTLSEADRTAVALARALDHWEAGTHLLLLDEVTASMPWAEARRLFESLRAVARTGVAVVFVSHKLDEVLEVADRVTVLRDGRRVVTTRTSGLSHDDLVEAMLGRELLVSMATAHQHETSRLDVAIELRGVRGEKVENIDLTVRPGEIVGVAGLTGSGRDELAGLISGQLARGGTVTVSGKRLHAGQPAAAIAVGLCCVPADRARDALLPTGSVRENTMISDVRRFWRRGVLGRRGERTEAQRWVEQLSIRPGSTEIAVTTLSGGNQQKVVLARWLRMSPRVLVLDEPTQGVDVGSKAEIHSLVDSAVEQGATVIVCSSDSDELARLCSRVLVMHRGVVAAEITGDEVTAEHIEQQQLQASVSMRDPAGETEGLR